MSNEAPTGTLRAACEQLTADIVAAVAKMKAALAGHDAEQTTVEELHAVTHVQAQLVKATMALDRLARGMFATTAELREREGIPITEREILGGCGCPGCTARLAATTATAN